MVVGSRGVCGSCINVGVMMVIRLCWRLTVIVVVLGDGGAW